MQTLKPDLDEIGKLLLEATDVKYKQWQAASATALLYIEQAAGLPSGAISGSDGAERTHMLNPNTLRIEPLPKPPAPRQIVEVEDNGHIEELDVAELATVE